MSIDSSPQEQPEEPTKGRVYRSSTNRVIAGVCGGLGEYFGIDPVLIRIFFVGLALVSGAGIVLYLLAWLVMPVGPAGEGGTPVASAMAGHELRIVLGGALILIGVLTLSHVFFDWFDDRIIWAVLLIALGAVIAVRGVER
jgi:phage shock protein PspC (stress-responsive transcriptional regulator)